MFDSKFLNGFMRNSLVWFRAVVKNFQVNVSYKIYGFYTPNVAGNDAKAYKKKVNLSTLHCHSNAFTSHVRKKIIYSKINCMILKIDNLY